jgi:CheY-like chemotaxis protein
LSETESVLTGRAGAICPSHRAYAKRPLAARMQRGVALVAGGPTAVRVVLVDDNAAVREAIGDALRRDGHDIVGEAGDGHHGVERAQQLRPDLIIIDWRMPGLDGIEAARRIRRTLPTLTIIAFCSTDSAHVERAFLDAGAHACIDKRDLCLLRRTVQALNTASSDST